VTGFDLGMDTSGGFSEYIRIPSQWAIQCPDGLSTKESMMLGTAGLTAGLAVDSIKNTCNIKDAKVVVSGATGGVGSIGVNLLSHLGAEVTAITGKMDEKRFLKKLGATEIIERNHFIKATKLPLSKGMYNAALDVVGGSMLSSILSSMYQNGIITVCGNVGGPKFETTVFPFILRGNSLVGIDSANSPIDKRKIIWKHFSSDWKLDGLEKYSKIVDLENLIPEIKNILAGKQTGRIILKL
jgi:putative YhdH/YhfP family quinone oxidoreductase